jgi:uncharacterized protein
METADDLKSGTLIRLSIAALLVWALVGLILYVPFWVITAGDDFWNMTGNDLVKMGERNGTLRIIEVTVDVAAVFFVVWALRRRGIGTVHSVLALNSVSYRTVLAWLAGGTAFVGMGDLFFQFQGWPIVSPNIVEQFRSPGHIPFLLLSAVFIGPLSEEIFFRGLLFTAVMRTRLGVTGATVITTLLWAALHLQQPSYQYVVLFFSGVLLSVARLRTGSLYVCIALHAMFNLISSVETAVVAYR